jgi:hypothetical protein
LVSLYWYMIIYREQNVQTPVRRKILCICTLCSLFLGRNKGCWLRNARGVNCLDCLRLSVSVFFSWCSRLSHTSEFRSRSPTVFRTLIHYLSHLDCSITCTFRGEIAREVGVRRSLVYWEHCTVFTAARVISCLHEMPRLHFIAFGRMLYSSMMFLVIHGCTWLCVVAPGCVWLHLVVCGCIWLYVVSPGYTRLLLDVWLHLVIYGCTWLYVVAPGHVWSRLVICGCSWFCVFAHDYVWFHRL